MIFFLLIVWLSQAVCKTPECISTVFKNTRISKQSVYKGAERLNVTAISLDDCLSECCSIPNCTSAAYYKSSGNCHLFNCGDPDICIRSESNISTLYEISKLVEEEPVNPFWARLLKQSKKQKALSIAVLVTISLVILAGVIFCFCLKCQQCKRRRRSPAKMRSQRTRNFGGSYRLLFNSEGEDVSGTRTNTLF